MTKYIVLATGSRKWPNDPKHPKHREVLDMVECVLLMVKGIWDTGNHDDLLVIHGGAEGFDTQVDDLCDHLEIETEIWRPEYHLYREDLRWMAPLDRNSQMVQEGPKLVIAGFVGNPEKGGTLDCTGKARRAGIPILALHIPKEWADNG